ncbi:MAG: glycosyl hydrolase [Haliscomenobacter sp.]|nr:glycosyl hydrolase [Haliscomenobacter sp.]
MQLKNLLFLLAGFAISLGLQAQKKASPVPTPPPAPTVQFDQTLYQGMQWRLVGPFRGGRAGSVTGVPGHPNLFYMGTAGGGVWRTQDGGQTWHCVSDGYFGGSIGAVAVAESDPNVIYAGEGEQTVRGNVSSGWGLWRSTDAGKSWKHIGLKASEHIGRIRVHPQNPDLVYVAAMGNLWKPSDERGVYRSKDGGTTWERILFESDKAGAVDLILDPNNPRIIYASTWEIKRNGYRMDSGGPGSHLWKSTDGGDTWTKLTQNPGMPKGVIGIIGIAVSPVNSNRLWTCIENLDGGVFRSDDGGDTWTRTSDFRELRQRAWYYSRIYADTKDLNKVYVANVDFWRSDDGGKNWTSIETPHGDHHDFWIDPDDNRRMAIADDGGAQISFDAGENWTTYHNQPTSQFYRVTTDNHFPFRILGAQQDNSTIRILHRAAGATITEKEWEPSAGGESAHLAPDPDNPDIVYGGSYKGYMSRVDHRTGQERSTNVWPDNPAGSGVEVMKYRFNWNFPIFFSPHDGNKLYAASNYLHVSYNEGQTWEVISPDLTRGDPETLKSSGGPITQDNTGVEFYANIFAVTESAQEPGVIWAGSDDGLLHVTRDGGKTWTNVTPPGSPRLNMMNCIDVNPFVKGGAYVAATSYKFGDYTPYFYKTTDYGKTWTKITAGIDPNHYARTIRADPKRQGLLYAGTEWGMYLSFDDGLSWKPFQLNLPVTSIADLHIRDNSLIAATHGRSFWMIDDLTPLHQLSADVAKQPHYLFKPKASYRMAQETLRGTAALRTQGENHPNGVVFHFYVKDWTDTAKAQLDLFELGGELIRSFSNTSKDRRTMLQVKKGGNRFVWDMRYPGFKDFPGMVLYSSPNTGPKAVPGTYKARLTINGQSVEQTFEILKDPRLPNTASDYEDQLDFLLQVRDRVSEAHQAITDIRAVKKDINYLKEKAGEAAPYQELIRQANELEKELSKIEGQIHQVKNQSQQDPINYGIKVNNRLAFLLADQQLGDFPPTDQAKAVYDTLSQELQGYLDQLTPLLKDGVGRLNKTATDLRMPLLKSS